MSQTTETCPTASPWLQCCARFVQRRLILLLLVSYAMAFFVPAPGMAIRSTTLAGIPLPLLLLFALLLLGGLGVEGRDFFTVLRHRRLLLVGLLALWLTPWACVRTLNSLALLPEPGVLIGLSLVAVMPAAASSVGWSQLSRGNVTISLGLAVTSTLVCPLAIGLLWRPDPETGPLAIKSGEVMIWIVPAMLVGMALRWCLGNPRVSSIRPQSRIASATILLLLNYANAAVALPQVGGNFDSRVLTTSIVLTALVCLAGFLGGWLLSFVSAAAPSAAHAIVFGVGMKNTGMALVLAGLWLESRPLATVVIITYTLLQHLLAGCYQIWIDRSRDLASPATDTQSISERAVSADAR